MRLEFFSSLNIRINSAKYKCKLSDLSRNNTPYDEKIIDR